MEQWAPRRGAAGRTRFGRQGRCRGDRHGGPADVCRREEGARANLITADTLLGPAQAAARPLVRRTGVATWSGSAGSVARSRSRSRHQSAGTVDIALYTTADVNAVRRPRRDQLEATARGG